METEKIFIHKKTVETTKNTNSSNTSQTVEIYTNIKHSFYRSLQIDLWGSVGLVTLPYHPWKVLCDFILGCFLEIQRQASLSLTTITGKIEKYMLYNFNSECLPISTFLVFVNACSFWTYVMI